MASSQDSALNEHFPETSVQGNCFSIRFLLEFYTRSKFFNMVFSGDDWRPHKNRKRRIRHHWNKAQTDAETCTWIGEYDNQEVEDGAKMKACKLTET